MFGQVIAALFLVGCGISAMVFSHRQQHGLALFFTVLTVILVLAIGQHGSDCSHLGEC